MPLRAEVLRPDAAPPPGSRRRDDGEPAPLTELRVIRTLCTRNYEWDAAKAAENLRKHGIDFPDALPAVEDL
jgi:hypothetical protein